MILTKLDGDARGGAALSMRETIGKPIMYCGTGEKVSDLEPFAPDRMASRILGMGDVLTLVERAQEQFDQKKAEEMVERSFAGRLTMDDWLAQLRQLRGMGSLEGVLGMMPGGRKLIQQAGAAMPSEQDLGRMEAIVLSMTVQERRHPELIKGSRRKRIAAGSGTTIADVNRLLKGFEQMQGMFKSLGGGRAPRVSAARLACSDSSRTSIQHNSDKQVSERSTTLVKIRLKRMGTTKRPVYRLVVADSRSPRDGRFIEFDRLLRSAAQSGGGEHRRRARATLAAPRCAPERQRASTPRQGRDPRRASVQDHAPTRSPGARSSRPRRSCSQSRHRHRGHRRHRETTEPTAADTADVAADAPACR